MKDDGRSGRTAQTVQDPFTRPAEGAVVLMFEGLWSDTNTILQP